jgi:hypothetical protein
VPKKTADLVALILAVVVAVVVILTAVTLLWISVNNPQQDIVGAADAIGRIVGTIVAALVGYMAGRATANGNGADRP